MSADNYKPTVANSNPRIVASIQVRMGSSRLPGKAMLEVCGQPLLGHLVERLRLCKMLHEIVVAIPTSPENDIIEQFCDREVIPCFRGSEEDVLDRTLSALRAMSATVGVEVFGDCPIIDPIIVDEIVQFFCNSKEYDFVSNDLKTTYPPGMEVEVFTVNALADSASRIEKNDPILEHGTLFIRQHADLYNIINLEAPVDVCRPDLELEVDTAEDLVVIEAIVKKFRPRKDFTLREIISFLDKNNEIAQINRETPRRWKEYRDD